MTSVGVIGANGRMGSLVGAALRETADLHLGAQVDVGDDMDALRGCEVAVDFTHPGVVMDHVAWCIGAGIHVVVGTSGFSEDRLEAVRSLLAGQAGLGVLVVPNFSIGAVLMMRFAAQAARFLESVEIVEMHHPDKLDAPSGTAIRTAQLVAAARSEAGLGPSPDATATDALGARGGTVEGVRVHSIRLRGAVAHQEVLLGNVGENLTIRHDMLDRSAAVAGVLAAVRAVPRLPGLTVGLERVLDLD